MNQKVFFTLQNGDNLTTIVIELYSTAFPKTTRNFLNNCTSPEQNYKFSQITRVISPEFIIQGGNTVRQERMLVLDEYATDQSSLSLPGKLLIVSNAEDPDELKSDEFFITLADLSKYEELRNYMVIGEVISGLQELIEWGNAINVNEDGIPLHEVVISRCGELIKRQKSEGASREHGHSSSHGHHHHHRRTHRDYSRDRDDRKDHSGRSQRSHGSSHHGSSRDRYSNNYSSDKGADRDRSPHYKTHRPSRVP